MCLPMEHSINSLYMYVPSFTPCISHLLAVAWQPKLKGSYLEAKVQVITGCPQQTTKLLHHHNWDAFTYAAHASQLWWCNYYLCIVSCIHTHCTITCVLGYTTPVHPCCTHVLVQSLSMHKRSIHLNYRVVLHVFRVSFPVYVHINRLSLCSAHFQYATHEYAML